MPSTFQTLRTLPLPELQCILTEVMHKPTGATILHLANDDEENVFCLSFKTWPEKSDGVAHILEHTVLCGSKEFPVKDPFFSMTRRSLNTFMNAFTGADFTCYPAASQVEKDFYNLLSVYLDAVFHPRLLELSFLQEGHRLELSDPHDLSSPLCFKGIVFNEMKGALSNPEARLGEALHSRLFPDLTYGINSGGDPEVIPELTYAQLKEFHATYYHPSRCLFYFYGNIPLRHHLAFLEEHAFQGVTKLAPLPLLPKQSRFQAPYEAQVSYPYSEKESLEEKNFVTIGSLTCSIGEQEEVLALQVIDLVLMGTDASPLKTALLRSGLCKQVDSSLDCEMSEIPFTLVCKGCKEDAAPKIEKVYRTTLEEVCKDGLPPHLIEGAIHQIEFSRSEITGSSLPFGLSLYFRSGLLKQHGIPPEAGLCIHSLFDALRTRCQDPTYLTGLIYKYLLDNPHTVRLTLTPDLTLAKKEEEEEQKRLSDIAGTLAEHDREALVTKAEELAHFQEEEDDLAVLPRISLRDVTPEAKEYSLEEETSGTLSTFSHRCFTNGILYSSLIFPIPSLSEDEVPLFRLFAHLLPQVGCGGRDYKAHLDTILEHTGGVGTALDLFVQADDPQSMQPALLIRGKALTRKVDKLFPLFCDMVETADFTDIPRLKELLDQHLHSLENSVQNSPLRYAVHLAASTHTLPAQITERWFGLHYYWKLKKMVEEFEKKPESLVSKMQALQRTCLKLEGAHLVLSGDESCLQKLEEERYFGLTDLPLQPFSPWKPSLPPPDVCSQGRLTSSPVAFTAMTCKGISYIDRANAHLSLASELMENKVLHKRIREQGGAYGSGAVNAALSGHFYFYAYRDPNLKSTLDAFREGVREIAEGNFSEDDLEEAKLEVIQGLDSPLPPGSRALTAYNRVRTGRTHARRQAYRTQLLQATSSDIEQATRAHLLPEIDQATCVTFAGKELLEKENALLTHPLPLLNV